MKTLRRFLALPSFLIAMLFASVMAAFAGPVPRAFQWLSGVVRMHMYWPAIVVYRYVSGVPLWEPIDLMIGVQPRTEADRKRADEHPDIAKQHCLCADPDCSYKQGKYVWMRGASKMADLMSQQSVEAIAMKATIKVQQLQAELDVATAELEKMTAERDRIVARLADLEARVSAVRETYVVN